MEDALLLPEQGWSATASTYYGQHPTALAMDGRIKTIFHTAGREDAALNWMQIDFAREVKVRNLPLFWRTRSSCGLTCKTTRNPVGSYLVGLIKPIVPTSLKAVTPHEPKWFGLVGSSFSTLDLGSAWSVGL